jgi:hypothetical protein
MSQSYDVVFNCDSQKKQEIKKYLDDGSIKATYQLDKTIYSMDLSEHPTVIDDWLERYKFQPVYGVGNWELEKLESQLNNSKKANRQHIENKFIGFTENGSTGFYGLCVLGFTPANKELNERIYYEFWSRVWLNSNDEKIFNLMSNHREELASLIICGNNDHYKITC